MPRTGSCCFIVVTLASALSLFTRHREEDGADGPAQTPIRGCSYGCCRRGWVVVPATRRHRSDGSLCSERPSSRPWPRSLRQGRSSLSTLPGLGPIPRPHWLHVLSLPEPANELSMLAPGSTWWTPRFPLGAEQLEGKGRCGGYCAIWGALRAGAGFAAASTWWLVEEQDLSPNWFKAPRVGQICAKLESCVLRPAAKVFQTLPFLMEPSRHGETGGTSREGNRNCRRASKTSFDWSFVWTPAKSNLAKKLIPLWRIAWKT